MFKNNKCGKYLKKEAEMIMRGQAMLFSKLETSIILLTKVKNQAKDEKLHLKII